MAKTELENKCRVSRREDCGRINLRRSLDGGAERSGQGDGHSQEHG